MIGRLQNLNTNNHNCVSNKTDKNPIKFKGGIIDVASRFETSPILSLFVVDLFGMILPRTWIDLNRNKKDLGHRNYDAGRETGLRELSTAFFMYFLPGLAAAGVGRALSKKAEKDGLNTKSYMQFKFLDAVSDHLKGLGKENSKKQTALDLKTSLISRLFDNVKPEIAENFDSKTKLSTIKKEFIEAIKDGQPLDEGRKKGFTELLSKSLGDSDLRLEYTGKDKKDKFIATTQHFINSLNDLCEHIDKVAAKTDKNATGEIMLDHFVEKFDSMTKDLNKLKAAKLGVGMGIGLATLLAFPKVNIWLTKKISHKDNFPGTSGLIDEPEQTDSTKKKENKKNNKPSFKGLSPKNWLKGMDFGGIATSRNAVMVLYASCIGSRLVNSRDKYEFRETSLRDSLGWTSLFFLAPFMERMIAYGLDKLRFHKTKPENFISLFKTSDGDLRKIPDFIDVINPFSKKTKLMKFANIDALKSSNPLKHLSESESNAVFKELYKNKLALYLSSLGISISVLGILIPKLNTRMTAKNIKAKKMQEKPDPTQPTNVASYPKRNSGDKKLTMEGFLNLETQQKRS